MRRRGPPHLLYFAAFALTASASGAASAATFTVNSAADRVDASPGDGVCRSSWFSKIPQCTLRAAVMEANALGGSHTITVSSSITTIGLSRSGSGENLAATGDLDVIADIAIQGNGVTVDGLALDRIFHVMGSLSVQDMVITNGYEPLVGGAIYNNGTLSLDNCEVSFSESAHGGAIKSYDGLTIVDSLFKNNIADRGGALYLSNANVDIEGTDFKFNSVTDRGGAIYATRTASVHPTLSVSDSLLFANIADVGGGIYTNVATEFDAVTTAQNSATDNGGGVYLASWGDLEANWSTFELNFAGGHGGGIDAWGPVRIRTTEIDFNTAGNRGGGARLHWSTATSDIEYSAVIRNTAQQGGGIANSATGTLRMQNATLSDNTAIGSGGGVYSSAGTMELNNVTIADNRTLGGNGGGVATAGGSLLLENTLLGINTSPSSGPDCYGSIFSQGHNLIEDASACTISGPATNDIYGLAPALSPLNYFGGPTPIHQLTLGSPAVDAGLTSSCETDDQHFVARPVGPACDIGAHER